jgi:broad specificity phosphatase PhoE
MEVYFIRHGETGGNKAKRHQAEKTRLTPRGREQAAAAAAVVAKLAPTHLIVSNRVRAIETARPVAEATGLTPDTNARFTELCRPAPMYGHKHRSPRSLQYLIRWWLGWVGGNDCGPAGESYPAFRQRLADARAALEQMPPDSRVVVVSHSVFITFFVVHMCDQRPLSLLGAIRTFRHILAIKNGSITHLRFLPSVPNTCSWHLVTRNDCHHLNS